MTSTHPPASTATIDPAIPSYVGALLDNETASTQDGINLPTYPGRPARPDRRVTQTQPKDFFYNIERNGKTWASLVVTADESISKAVPTFIEGKPIEGRVELHAGKGANDIRGVGVTFTGEVAGDDHERVKFLNISDTLWTREMGDQKLIGDLSWKFRFALPNEVSFPNGKEMGAYRLPQTISERFARGGIMYKITVRFLRGKLSADTKLAAQVGFIPMSYPPSFSSLRQLAYQEGLPNLLDPTVDPEGWHSQELGKFKGRLFDVREVEATCQLHLAKPLSYTRGTVIPLYLTLQCSDNQALSLLSNPQVPVVQLQRKLLYGINKRKEYRNEPKESDISRSLPGTWWLPPNSGTETSDGTRLVLNGELHLPNDLVPTTAMGQFRIEYTVVLFPFAVAGFEPVSSRPLLEQPVDIVTAHAPGPRPRRLTPPGYENDQSLQLTAEAKARHSIRHKDLL